MIGSTLPGQALLKLAERWRADAELPESYGATEAAAAARKHAAELVDAIREEEDAALTLSEAAAESGYSSRRLRELVSSGAIPNAGRKGAPRIRRGDLPRRSRHDPGGFDPFSHVQSILAAGSGGR